MSGDTQDDDSFLDRINHSALVGKHTAAIRAFYEAKTPADEKKALDEVKRIEAILFAKAKELTRGG